MNADPVPAPAPAETPWLRMVHTVTAEVPLDKWNAAAVVAFLSHVPDHAEPEFGDPTDLALTRTMYATWPHEDADDAVHARTCLQYPGHLAGFDIGQDVEARPADYALTQTGFEDEHSVSQAPEGCEARWNDRPCIRAKGHNSPTSPHVYRAAPVGGDLYGRTADQ